MSTRKMTQGELRTIERVANDFDAWASARRESPEEILMGVTVSLAQQLVPRGHSRQWIEQVFSLALDAAANPLNASVDPKATAGDA